MKLTAKQQQAVEALDSFIRGEQPLDVTAAQVESVGITRRDIEVWEFTVHQSTEAEKAFYAQAAYDAVK